jgi:DNA repair exonuclease SbcCD nuclease subunit
VFSFIHAADIHLDSPLHRLDLYEGAPVEAIRSATRRAFENLVRLALEEQVDFVLISGDLYDGDWRDYNTGLYFLSQVSRLQEASIPVYIVAGNHDAASRITKTLRLPEYVHLFPAHGPETYELPKLDVAIHGQSFPTPAVKQDLSLNYPPSVSGWFNIGMLHTCLTGREGHAPYAPCTVEGLTNKGYDYWALGHVHRRESVREAPWIVFPGNIQGRHIRESGPKGCLLVKVDERGRAVTTFKPLDVIRWEEVVADGAQSESGHDVVAGISHGLDSLLEQAPGLPLVVRVIVRGLSRGTDALAAEPELWKNEIRAAALGVGADRIWIEKVELRPESSSVRGRSWGTGGPVGEILSLLDEIQADADQLLELGRTLQEIVPRLPRELKEGEERFDAGDPEWLMALLDQVRPMLLQRLRGAGERP